MREVFERILERLECYIGLAKSEGDFTYIEPFEIAKRAVKEVAEESATDTNVGTNGWIPCSERLPELDGTYICTCQGIAESITLIFSTHDNSWNDEFEAEYDDVIAWKPLPEPYKEA